MKTARIIPCLDVTDGRVVKGVNFVGLRDAGDPVELAARYDADGADELVFLDITATSDGRETMVDVVRRTAEQVFIPFTIGGGIRTVDDARTMLRAGADKVSVNSAAVARPELISEIAEVFGNQCVVCAIDARRRASDGSASEGWEVYVAGGRTPTGMDGHNALNRSALARSFSRQWIVMAPATVSTLNSLRRYLAPLEFQSSRLAVLARSIISSMALWPAAPTRCSLHRFFTSTITQLPKRRNT